MSAGQADTVSAPYGRSSLIFSLRADGQSVSIGCPVVRPPPGRPWSSWVDAHGGLESGALG